MVDFIFADESSDRLFAETHPENTASQNVLRKLNFRNAGLRHYRYDYIDGFDTQVVWEIGKNDRNRN